MIGSDVFLSEVSTTSTAQLAPVGTIRSYIDVTHGFQQYRMVKATADIDAKELVAFAAGSSVNAAKSAATSPAAATIAGIAVVDIASGSYGWVCCSGNVTGLADAAVSQNAPIIGSATDGQLDDANLSTNEHCVIGVAITDGSGFSDGEDLVVRLSGLI